MTIEIHKPELEALIKERMKTRGINSVEDALIDALKSSPSSKPGEPRQRESPRKISLNSSLSPHCAGLACDWIVKRTIHGPLSCERVSCRYERHLRVHQAQPDARIISWLEAADQRDHLGRKAAH